MRRALASWVWFSQVFRARHRTHLHVGAHPVGDGLLGVCHPQSPTGVGSYKGQSEGKLHGHTAPLNIRGVGCKGAVYVA